MLPLTPDTQIVVKAVGGADIPTGTVAVTPAGLKNVVVKVVKPLTIILVRALRTFLQTLLGGLGLGGATAVAGVALPGVPLADFMVVLQVSASIAASAAIVSIIQNLIELLGKLDQSMPTWTA